MTEPSATGSCLCGAVRFKTRGALRPVIYCHCPQCRKQSGHFFAATSVPDDCLTVDGADAVKWYASSDFARRGFCGTCGSLLFWKREGADEISILAGAFDEPSGLVEGSHIFTETKGSYYGICDGLPAFERTAPRVPTDG